MARPSEFLSRLIQMGSELDSGFLRQTSHQGRLDLAFEAVLCNYIELSLRDWLRSTPWDCRMGCDASLLLDSTSNNTAEKDAPPNLSLAGFDVIDEIKTQLEKTCPGVVSCADILTLAARDSVSFKFNRSMWEVLTGRRDGNISRSSEVLTNLPSPFSNFTTLKQNFSNRNLTVHDLVVLSGAHTIGVGHCNLFSNRLYNFTGKGDSDPSLNSTYAAILKTQCQSLSDTTTTVEMDPQSSLKFDNNYFAVLKQQQGLFQSDAALLTNKGASNVVDEMLSPSKFFTEFGQSMERMGVIGVLTGSSGEIRKKCSVRRPVHSTDRGLPTHSATHHRPSHQGIKIENHMVMAFISPQQILHTRIFALTALIKSVRFCNGGELKLKYYHKSCPAAEFISQAITWDKLDANPSLAVKLLRLHYHDCFVRVNPLVDLNVYSNAPKHHPFSPGCDASLLLDSTSNNTAEKDAIPNLSLAGFDVIDEIKTQLEKTCPGVVSCADILTLAARDSVSFKFNRSMWEVLTGRRDGNISRSSEVLANLPSPFSNFTTLKQNFANKKLTVHDLVVLSGAHTIGVGHCNLFSNRLYNFTGKGDSDPSLNSTYAAVLKTQCQSLSDTTTTVEMDPQSSLKFDNNYFTVLKQHQGLFQSDAALLTNKGASNVVDELLSPSKFFTEFGQSMERMGVIGVLTGSSGEIRKKCSVVGS
ncbi:hypothetical protein LguiA_031143 [Lonicera macranthoides]